MADRTNSIDLSARVFNIRDLQTTKQGKPVCNARINVAGKLDDEWHPIWIELTAWDNAANILANCQHGDDIIVRGGRLGAKAYRNREGVVIVEPSINCDNLERVGSLGAGPSAPVRDDNDSIPF